MYIDSATIKKMHGFSLAFDDVTFQKFFIRIGWQPFINVFSSAFIPNTNKS